MEYSRNAVYTAIRNAIKTAHPEADCTARYVPKPSSFPACYIREIDNNRPIQYTQLDFDDVQCESVFEIQIQSDKHNTAASEAYDIMKVADLAFSRLYYRRFSQVTVDNGDTFVIVGRYRRKIGGGDTMPNIS